MSIQTAISYKNCYMVSLGEVKDVILAKIVEEQLNNTHIVTVLNSTRNRHVFIGKNTHFHKRLKNANFIYKVFRQHKMIHVFWVYNLLSKRIGSFFIDNLIQFLVERNFPVTTDVHIRKIEEPLFRTECTSTSEQNPAIINVADNPEGTLLISDSPKSKKNIQARKLQDNVRQLANKVNHSAQKFQQLMEIASHEEKQICSDQVELSAARDFRFGTSDVEQDTEFAEIRKLKHSTAEQNKMQVIPSPIDHFTCTKLECDTVLPGLDKEVQRPTVPPLVYLRMREDAKMSCSESEQNLQPVQPVMSASRETKAQRKEDLQADSPSPTGMVKDYKCNPQDAQSNESNISALKEDISDESQNSERNEIEVLKYAFNVLTICAKRAKTEMFHLPCAANSISLNTSNEAVIDEEKKNIEQNDEQNVSTESKIQENKDNVNNKSNVSSTSDYESRNPSPENQGINSHDGSVRNNRSQLQAVITESKEESARNAADESHNYNKSLTNAEIYSEQRRKYSFDEADIGTRSWARQRSFTPTSSLSAGYDSTIEIRVDHSKLPNINSDETKTDKKQTYTCKELIQPARKRPLYGKGSNRIDPLQLLKVRTVQPMNEDRDPKITKKKRAYKRKQKNEKINHSDNTTDCLSKETKETVQQEEACEEKNKTRGCSVKLVPLEKLIMYDMRSKN